MTLDHGSLGPEDVRTVMRAGVSKQAIQDAMEVAFLFNIYDRLADAMGWDVPPLAGGYYQVARKKTTQTRVRVMARSVDRSLSLSHPEGLNPGVSATAQ